MALWNNRGLAKLLGPLAGKLVKYPFLNNLLLLEGMEFHLSPLLYIDIGVAG